MTTSEKETRTRFYQKIAKITEVLEAEVKYSVFNYFEKMAIHAIIKTLKAFTSLAS